MRGRLRLSANLPILFFAGLCLPADALAQERTQESTQARSREPDEQEIVVEAERGDRTLIDRETYIVRDTPLAQTRTAVDVIQNLPSVTIDAAGQLRLLGNRNVKVLIDGRDVPNANVILSTLQASQIARIEVMTNPSAQFSAYGSAGIINIILRRSFADGLAGSSVVGAGNLGYFTARLSPTWSDGTWSISASPALTSSDSRTERLVERVGTSADPSLNRIEDETGRGTSRAATASGQISFRSGERKRYNLTASISRLNGESERSALISSPLNSFPPFTETSSGRSTLDSETVSLERTVNGDQEGEEFKLALSWSHFAASAQSSFADLLPAQPRTFALASSTDQTLSGIKADHTVRVGERAILSIGAELQRERQRIRDTASGELLSGPVDTSETFTGRWLDMSIYGTLQTQLGSFRILPGLRVQRRRFEFDRASGFAPTGGTLFFPSLHVERRFGNLTTTFSISRRADWPSIAQFLPYRRITGPTTADTGNPALGPERTLNIEAAARLSVSGQQLSLNLYSRQRSNVRDTAISIAGNGDILSTPVNTGNRLSRGGQLSVRGRLSPGWRYSASAYVAASRFDRLEGTAIIRDDALEYGGNAQLEYSDGNQGTRGFDQATLNLRYQGPTQNLQIRTNGLLGVDISYTHYLTDRISIVSTLSRVIGQVVVTERSAIGFQERSLTDLYGPLFRFTINYRFGRRTSPD